MRRALSLTLAFVLALALPASSSQTDSTLAKSVEVSVTNVDVVVTDSKGQPVTDLTAADFEVRLKLDDARLPDLNPLFLAYSGVDVAEGQLSLFSEIKVKDGRVNGYFKPLIKHLKIYDKQKDQDKPFGNRVKMHLLQFLAYLFKNRSSQEVATVVRLSGPTSDPKASEWEVIRRLIGNGFARAILPGFMRPADERKPAPAAGPRPQGDR